MKRCVFLALVAAFALVACGDDGTECIPLCGNRVCGEDPVCGTSCGTCEGGATCEAGACVAAPTAACDGYSGWSTCCAEGDPCALAGDGYCDCDATCGWDADDCATDRCRVDGRCDESCEADPDCAAPCACDHHSGLCEAGATCAAEACACDPDCADGTACQADGQCDPWCPRGGDADCAGDPHDGQFCCLPDCEGRDCGDDGCGGTCGDCGAGNECVSSRCTVMCGEIGFRGCCDGAQAVWCENGELFAEDCGTAGCGFLDAETGNYCGGEGEDPTGALPLVCVYPPCEPDCSGRVCGDDGCGGSCGDCGAGQTCAVGVCRAFEGCGTIDFLGCCVGDVALWCEDGALAENDCAAEGPCGWTDADNGYFCGGTGADPGGRPKECVFEACTPACGAHVCGDDGCGGSCGACADGEACRDGACAACTPDCGTRVCGDDGCGGSCGDCAGTETCDAGACVAVPDECGGITILGCCDGNTPVWCEDGQLWEADCSEPDSGGTTCGWTGAEYGYYCGGEGPDPTGEVAIDCGFVE